MGRIGLLLLAGLAMLAAPGSTTAATPPAPGGATEIQEPDTSGTAFLGSFTRRGETYDVQLSTPNSRVAVLYVHGGPLREIPFSQWTRYAVSPRRSLAGGVLEADFGAIGSVSLRFEPTGRRKIGRVSDHCEGRRPRREDGEYTGSISLRGENGYFRLRRVAAKGRRTRSFRLRCDPGHAVDAGVERTLSSYVAPALPSHGPLLARLETASESGGRYVGFDAWEPPSSYGSLAAGVIEALPGMTIGRYSYMAYPTSFMTSDPGPGPLSARLSSASYNADPSAPETWDGDLTATFPGGLEERLNGPEFRTRLCAYRPPGSPPECVGARDPLLSGGPFDPAS